VDYYIDYCESFGYHSFLGRRVVRPVDALVGGGGEGALWATRRLRAAPPPRFFVTFD
jgi:hypothetical protein